MIDNTKHFLFSYGTLQFKNVQLENYGRMLAGEKDSLKNFKLIQLKITDSKVVQTSGQEYHPIAVQTNNSKDFIEGTIFEISKEELLKTDAYEVSDYERVLKTFLSGKKAWIYVAKKQ